MLSYPDPELENGTLRLRKWRETDLECVRLAGTDPSIPKGTTVPAQFTPEEGIAFVRRQWGRLDDGEGISLAIALADTDIAVGLTTLMQHHKYDSIYEIGYWLIPEARGSAFAAQAARLISEWALSVDGIERVEAHVDTSNTSSLRTLEQAAFKQEGVLRRYLQFNGVISDAAVFSVIKP